MLFGKKDKSRKTQTVKEVGPMTEEEVKDSQAMVARIGKQESKGFFIVVEYTDSGSTRTGQGSAKVSQCNRMQVLETVLETFGFKHHQLQTYLAIKALGGDDDE